MSEPEDILQLAADFPPATYEEWRGLVDGVLKGAPFERLVSVTYDGLAIAPLSARRCDARPVAARAGDGAWQVLARIDDPDAARANETARHELENGAAGLSLVFAGSVGDHGFGLPPTDAALARALEGIDLSKGIGIEFDLSPLAEAVIDAALAKGFPFGSLRVFRLGHDPLGAIARDGGAARPWREEAPHFARRLAALARRGLDGGLTAADGRVIHDAGGSEAQELAFVLGAALAYMRALEAEHVALEAARRMIFFRLSADADQFLTIAKFRALRKLWARVEAACGLAAEAAFVSAETAWRMMTRRDPHVNILRATIAVSAAALGGADAITVLPFTLPCGLPDRFARRIARNMQLILLEEAHLANVADPAAGSGAVEDLTEQLCGAAWALFREIESAGGVPAALASGLIREQVAAVREQRATAVASARDALTGVSIFPNLNESEVPVLQAVKGKSSPAPLGSETQRTPTPFPNPPPQGGRERPVFAPLLPIRLAEQFEKLRDASDRVLTATGTRPRIFLATLGAPTNFTAPATFARNFFAAGGIEAVSRDDHLPSPSPLPLLAVSGGRGEERPTADPDLDALVSAFKASGAVLVCLCSSDKHYETEAPAAAHALKAAPARHVYLAGRPGEREAALRVAGVQSFVYEGCAALAILKAAYDILGIETG